MATKRPDGRVEPGQRISSAFSARAWNRAQDAADVVLGARTGATAGEPQGGERASNIVIAFNSTGFLLPMLGVVSISAGNLGDLSGATIDGTNQASSLLRQVIERPLLTASLPGPGAAIGISLEPIPDGKWGRVAMSGVVFSKINVTNFGHNYADARVNDMSQLQSAACGPIKIIWYEKIGSSRIGPDQWAVVLL